MMKNNNKIMMTMVMWSISCHVLLLALVCFMTDGGVVIILEVGDNTVSLSTSMRTA